MMPRCPRTQGVAWNQAETAGMGSTHGDLGKWCKIENCLWMVESRIRAGLSISGNYNNIQSNPHSFQIALIRIA